jgi:hypothetical protein
MDFKHLFQHQLLERPLEHVCIRIQPEQEHQNSSPDSELRLHEQHKQENISPEYSLQQANRIKLEQVDDDDQQHAKGHAVFIQADRKFKTENSAVAEYEGNLKSGIIDGYDDDHGSRMINLSHHHRSPNHGQSGSANNHGRDVRSRRFVSAVAFHEKGIGDFFNLANKFVRQEDEDASDVKEDEEDEEEGGGYEDEDYENENYDISKYVIIDNDSHSETADDSVAVKSSAPVSALQRFNQGRGEIGKGRKKKHSGSNNNAVSRLQCPKCFRVFCSVRNLKRHVRTMDKKYNGVCRAGRGRLTQEEEMELVAIKALQDLRRGYVS